MKKSTGAKGIKSSFPTGKGIQNNLFYKHLVELTPEAIVIHSEGKIMYANPSALRLMDAKNKKEVLKKNVLDFIHPESLPIIEKRIRTLLIKNKVAPFIEEKFITLGGKIVIAETKTVPFVFDGKPAILAILHDVTAKKQMEDTLQKSEERFRALIQHSADAIQLIDKTGKIIYTSNSITKVLGYTPQEVIGKRPIDYIHPADLPQFLEAFHDLLAQKGRQVTLEYRVKHKDGSWAWIEATGVSHLETPNINAIIGNFRNITLRKKSQERQEFLYKVSSLLSRSIDYKTTLANISKVLVPYFADYIRVVLINQRGELEEVVVNHDDPSKQTLVTQLYKEYRNRTDLHHGVEKVIQTGKADVVESVNTRTTRYLTSSKKMQDILTQLDLKSYIGVPLKIAEKAIGAITFSSTHDQRIYTQEDVSFAEEVARRISYAVENSRLYTHVQEALRLRDDFISVASHELKTPITSLKMYTQILENKIAKKDGSELPSLTKMNEQIDKLTKLINDLLNASKLQHGKLEFAMEEIDLNEIVNDIVSTIQLSVKQHIISIHGKVTKKIRGDKDRISQVIANLLTNAVKFSPKAKKVMVILTQSSMHAKISVKDFGIGIDDSQKKHIFEQFYRVTNPEERTYPGLGMGLYIASEIVSRHNGKITVTSKKGLGSTFSFTLPYC